MPVVCVNLSLWFRFITWSLVTFLLSAKEHCPALRVTCSVSFLLDGQSLWWRLSSSSYIVTDRYEMISTVSFSLWCSRLLMDWFLVLLIIKAWYSDPFSFHTTTDHGGANSSIQKQNGRDPHLQKREIPKPDQRARKWRLQSCGDVRWGWCQRIRRVISLQPSD